VAEQAPAAGGWEGAAESAGGDVVVDSAHTGFCIAEAVAAAPAARGDLPPEALHGALLPQQ
jgi:hypothetical protein